MTATTSNKGELDKNIINDLISAYEHGIINLDDVLQKEKDIRMKELLKQHKYAIKYNEKDNRWHTYVPDDTKPNKRRPVAKRERAVLYEYLIDFYSSTHDEEQKTFKNAFLLFQEKKLSHVKTAERKLSKENTEQKRSTEYKRFFANTDIENKLVSNISKKELEEIIFYNLERYELKEKGFKSLCGVIKCIFDYSYQNYWTDDNLYTRIDLKDFKDMIIPDVDIKLRVHSAEEIGMMLTEIHERMLKRPKQSTLWALELQILIGARRGEVPPLQWNDLYNNELSISKQQISTKYGFHIVQHTKTNINRELPISNEVRIFLDKLRIRNNIYYPNSAYLFPANNEKGVINGNAVYQLYDSICQSLGIVKEKGITKGPHSFRRNAITDVMNSTNGNAYIASALFGNSPEVINKNYFTDIDRKTALNALNQRKFS